MKKVPKNEIDKATDAYDVSLVMIGPWKCKIQKDSCEATTIPSQNEILFKLYIRAETKEAEFSVEVSRFKEYSGKFRFLLIAKRIDCFL